MAEIKITKVKILKDSAPELEYKIEKGKDSVARNENHTAKPHEDFVNSLLGLKIHLAILTDYVKPKQVKKITEYDSELVEEFNVTGFSVKGKSEEEEGVVITGYKITPSGQIVTLNTPFTRFNAEEDVAYKYMDHLQERIDVCISEALAYIRGEKKAPEPQQELPFAEETA